MLVLTRKAGQCVTIGRWSPRVDTKNKSTKDSVNYSRVFIKAQAKDGTSFQEGIL